MKSRLPKNEWLLTLRYCRILSILDWCRWCWRVFVPRTIRCTHKTCGIIAITHRIFGSNSNCGSERRRCIASGCLLKQQIEHCRKWILDIAIGFVHWTRIICHFSSVVGHSQATTTTIKLNHSFIHFKKWIVQLDADFQPPSTQIACFHSSKFFNHRIKSKIHSKLLQKILALINCIVVDV